MATVEHGYVFSDCLTQTHPAIFWLLYIIVLLLVQLKADHYVKHWQTGMLVGH